MQQRAVMAMRMKVSANREMKISANRKLIRMTR
jgi:hypothetical protein